MRTKFNYGTNGSVFIIGLAMHTLTFAQSTSDYDAEVEKQKTELAVTAKANETIAQNLATFDESDFEVFTNQEWKRLHESHSEDILVRRPDGHTTAGIDRHMEDLAAMFVYSPDTRIKERPIKIGTGNLTAVMGVIEGMFTRPMPIGGGKYIEPTGKAFKLNMVTIGIWNENGIIYLG